MALAVGFPHSERTKGKESHTIIQTCCKTCKKKHVGLISRQQKVAQNGVEGLRELINKQNKPKWNKTAEAMLGQNATNHIQTHKCGMKPDINKR